MSTPDGLLSSTASGPVLFARYAYPPNALGFCGPSDPSALFDAALAGDGRLTLVYLASRFEGAWPYLQLIAACNRIADPLDARVVEAYWVGNRLLERVPSPTLVSSLGDRFEQRAGRLFEPIAATAALHGGVPHHSFHVFAVYPWFGMLRGGMTGAPLTVLDRCRIRWGTVEDLFGDSAVVRSSSLEFAGSRLALGDERPEVVRRSVDGVGFRSDLAVGDVVSLHWDWVCDRLSGDALDRLKRYSARNLAAVNALATPGPTVAADQYGD